jgi:hypothetical protein
VERGEGKDTARQILGHKPTSHLLEVRFAKVFYLLLQGHYRGPITDINLAKIATNGKIQLQQPDKADSLYAINKMYYQ